ncbi:MAG: peptide ABC transporter substrate-binding protein, partial [Candidatus Bathyarchaeota archaeon]|nr:peptide ABC transporter substrate-binding protein [Candidatus Bathyarchaeota archaeon]
MKRIYFLLMMAIVISLIGTACGGAATPGPTATPVVITKEVTKEVVKEVTKEVTKEVVKVVTPTPMPITGKIFANFGPGDVPTLDTALGTDTSSLQIVEETTVGLTRIDEVTNETQPGMAEKWTLSADGLTYTFNLRKDVKWVKYNTAAGKVEVVKDAAGADRVVNAMDFVYAIKRVLDPKTASLYAYVYTAFIKGAEEFNTADTAKLSAAELTKLGDAVAVRAVNTDTLTITIKEPVGFFPNIAGMWQIHAQPQWLIEEKGDRWTEAGFYQGYGPYTLKEWVHEASITIIANPFWPGTAAIPKPKINEVTGYMLDETPAMANYETGKQDVVGAPLADIDRIKADPKLSKELMTGPSYCTYYYGFNVKKKPFDNVKVRQAFSMAIDRVSLIANVTKGGQEPAQWFARPGLVAAPTIKDYPNLGVKSDAVKAKALLTEAGFADVTKLGEITLMYNTSEGHKKIAEAIQQMWQKALGVTVKVANQEWKVYLTTMQTDAPQIFRLGWCMDYPDASYFDKEVFHTGSAQNSTNWSSKTFDALVDKAMVETDIKKRAELYAQAEQILSYDEAP